MHLIFPVLLAYLLGSIVFGLVLTRAFRAGDLRAIGSGNVGATNVLRTGHKGLAAATLLLDGAKGAIAVLLAGRFWPGSEAAAAVAAIVGHCFPVWLRFRGGKGVATLLGVAFGLGWPIGMAATVAWLAVLALVRISSLAGMSAAVAAPLAAWALGQRDYPPALTVIALLVIWQHRGNLARLRTGTEPKVGAK